ncbi:MAG: transcription termination/antitermination protein NusG [Oscillospiraceae bacterium]|nr:transcription termination/antitermination protein NusG [Oscillospiraceae bacterium]
MADSEAKWYILHTYSGYEKKVAADIAKLVENRNLQHLIEGVTIPTVTRQVEGKNGEMTEVEDKLYPGYVFVKMVETNESWYICRNTRGVTGFVGPEGKPTPLSENEVRSLEQGRTETAVAFAVGDRVAIRQGVLEGFEGDIVEIDAERQTVVVNVNNMFGEVTPTTLEIAAIKKI